MGKTFRDNYENDNWETRKKEKSNKRKRKILKNHFKQILNEKSDNEWYIDFK